MSQTLSNPEGNVMSQLEGVLMRSRLNGELGNERALESRLVLALGMKVQIEGVTWKIDVD